MAQCQVVYVAGRQNLVGGGAPASGSSSTIVAESRKRLHVAPVAERHQSVDTGPSLGHKWPMRRKSSKRQFLQAARAWNDRARLVQSPLFQQSDFFDPRDKVQVKYEMLRAALVDGVTVSEASRQFGYSRESFYTAVELFRDQGILALADAKRGPRQPRKLTPKVQRFLMREMENDPSLSGRELAERIAERLAVNVHHRSVERFRRAHGKKNRRAKR